MHMGIARSLAGELVAGPLQGMATCRVSGAVVFEAPLDFEYLSLDSLLSSTDKVPR